MSKFKRLYGLDWNASWPDVYIDMVCAKKWREEPYKHGNLKHPADHLLAACRALFTPEEFSISRWSSEHALDWTTESFCVTWGCASCSKSNDYGCFSLLDWGTDPLETVTLLASTTREMLKMRSYESVVRYFNILKRNPYFLFPGKESRTACAILNSNDDDSPTSTTTVKASIRGVAVNDGGSLQGAHLPYVRLILDEMALMRQDTFDARINLRIGAAKDFKFSGLANPETLFDLSSRCAVPLDGWHAVNEQSTEWRSRYGKIRHHNGFNSPAITEPDGLIKFPYLINQKQIDEVLAEEHGQDDSPKIWTMIKGFPPPQGLERTVLTEADLITFEAQGTAPWAAGESPVRIAALDAAFTHEGDGCVLKFADVGRIAPGVPAIVFGDRVYFQIESSSKRPVTQQIIDQLRENIEKQGVSVGMLAIDDSGTQGVADAVEMALGLGVTRYNYATKASDLLTVGGRDKFSDRYADKATELWVLCSEFVRARQIRGMDNEAAKYMTSRRFVRRKNNAKTALETKREFKKRTGGRSPDEGDVAAMLCGLARDVLGFNPGKFPQRFTAQSYAPQGIINTNRKGGIVLRLRSNYGASAIPKGYA